MGQRGLLSGLLAVVLALGGELAEAQRAPTIASGQSPITTSELTRPILAAIQDLEGRTVAIAEDFPDELYNSYRPKGNPDVRTAAEILLHIAEQNQSYASVMRAKQQQDALFAAGKVPHSKDILTFVSKQDTVEKVKASFAAVREAIQGNPDPKNLEHWLYIIAHGNAHFGNLVTYYRENGLVPPASR